MEYQEFENYINNEALKNNINIKNINNFYKYMKSLLEWNQKINLTAIKDEKEFVVKHFIDSLTVSKFIEEKDKIIDVGTGAGFPGIPLKLIKENLEVTLIDSVNKKINVLNSIIKKLELKDIEGIHTRAEDLANNLEYRECFDIAVSRAVSNMTTLVEYLIPFVKIGGLVICMKGPNYEEELERSKRAINLLGGEIENIEKFNINNELERNIILIRKIKSTPKKYPRGQGRPLREPLE